MSFKYNYDNFIDDVTVLVLTKNGILYHIPIEVRQTKIKRKRDTERKNEFYCILSTSY